MVSATLAVSLLLLAVLGIAAHLVDGQRQAMAVSAALAHVLMLAAVPGTVVATVSFGWWGGVAGVVVLCCAAATQARLYRARLHRDHADTDADTLEMNAPSLTVLHANIWLGRADLDALAALIVEHRPDVLTLVELTPEADEGLRSRVSNLLPHSYVSAAPGGDGTGIYSRHRLLDEQRHDGFVTELLSARLDMPGRPLVFAVHPVPPWPRHPSEWVRELASLHQLLDKIPVDDGPVIVAGDFNSTQDHRRYRALQNGRFHDAAVATGAGMLRTYPAHTWYPPVIAIDHVLVAGLAVRAVSAVPVPGSDHRGMLARLQLEPDQSLGVGG